MKYCKSCNKYYGDSDRYCLKCNRLLTPVDDGGVPEVIKNDIARHDRIESLPHQSRHPSPRKISIDSNENIPKCPICGSTSLSKITNAHKASKMLLFGVFGMGENGKTWKCNNCESKF
ncbi:hypothetical protein [uncultured Oscillibacter sp.]|uniref:hypothetical protein n=1 Tax=uncultured Oscillibacter sp. TaxID=876091 RepID=UPI0025FACB5B|nr:hypothetical protein [uncultured Oscillibacter sp.]